MLPHQYPAAIPPLIYPPLLLPHLRRQRAHVLLVAKAQQQVSLVQHQHPQAALQLRRRQQPLRHQRRDLGGRRHHHLPRGGHRGAVAAAALAGNGGDGEAGAERRRHRLGLGPDLLAELAGGDQDEGLPARLAPARGEEAVQGGEEVCQGLAGAGAGAGDDVPALQRRGDGLRLRAAQEGEGPSGRR